MLCTIAHINPVICAGKGGPPTLDKYKKLFANTIIFAIGTFSSKMLSIFLLPYYTRILTGSQISVGDLLVQTANLMIPFASVGIANAIIRFGLDTTVDKRDVFTSGLVAVGIGYFCFLLLSPIIQIIPFDDQMRSHFYLVYIYVLTSCLRALCAQFVRARQLVRLYAFDGILSTATVILFNLLFLSVFELGITGYVLATICSDFLSALFLFSIAGLRRFIRFAHMDWSVLGSMMRYAIPLIPANVLWWVTNSSDRYFISAMVGHDMNGLYTLANRIPTIIMLLSSIFTDAWQMSAITENGPGRDRFFTKVFNAYLALILTAASGVILLTRPITRILLAPKVYDAWQYVPLLLLASCFSCFVTFLGSIYMVEKRSIRTLITTAAGALLNILLNALLIPHFGANGAAFATFFSYFLVFVVRIIDTHRYIRIKWSPMKLVINLGILLFQSWLLLALKDDPKWILYEALLCALMILVNLHQILLNIQKFVFRNK